MIQNFPYKQTQTIIDLQKIKSQINIILAEFERKDELKADVKTLNTTDFTSTDFNEMTNLKNFIVSVLNSTINLENDVKTLFKIIYDNDAFSSMTNLNIYLDNIYEKINSLKDDVKTLLTSGFSYDDFNAMTGNKDFIKIYVKYLFNTGYTSTDITQMAALTNYMNIYLLISNLTYEVKYRLTSIYSTSDYQSMTGLTNYINSLIPADLPPVFINLRQSTSTGDNNYLACDYTPYTTFFQYHYRLIFLFLCKSDNSTHFDHLYAFRSKTNSVTSGSLFTVFNFFPSSTLVPYVFAVGDTNVAVNDHMILQIMIGNKLIKIDFDTISQWTGRTYCYHVKFINCNLDGVSNNMYPTASHTYPNANAFKYSDMKQNTVLDDTTKAYHEYDYLIESNEINLTAYMVNDGAY